MDTKECITIKEKIDNMATEYPIIKKTFLQMENNAQLCGQIEEIIQDKEVQLDLDQLGYVLYHYKQAFHNTFFSDLMSSHTRKHYYDDTIPKNNLIKFIVYLIPQNISNKNEPNKKLLNYIVHKNERNSYYPYYDKSNIQDDKAEQIIELYFNLIHFTLNQTEKIFIQLLELCLEKIELKKKDYQNIMDQISKDLIRVPQMFPIELIEEKKEVQRLKEDLTNIYDRMKSLLCDTKLLQSNTNKTTEIINKFRNFFRIIKSISQDKLFIQDSINIYLGKTSDKETRDHIASISRELHPKLIECSEIYKEVKDVINFYPERENLIRKANSTVEEYIERRHQDLQDFYN